MTKTDLPSWEREVDDALENLVRVSGRRTGLAVSERTRELTETVAKAAIRRLHWLDYKVQHIKNLSDRHIAVLVHDWYYTQKKATKTMENQLSRLRVFCQLLGKPNMVKSLKSYLPEVDPKLLQVTSIAKASKAWTVQPLDLQETFERVDRHDWRLGLMVRMELAFGLRREEVIKCRPWVQDRGMYLDVLEGQGKGGRPRTVPIATSAQREVLDFVKARIKKNEFLGWPETRRGQTATLKQNLKRYANEMARLGFTKQDKGITGHGLRAQFAENAALLSGLVPPTLQGTKDQLEADEMKLRTTRLSESMGHSRGRVMSSYYGSFRYAGKTADAKAFAERVHEALAVLGPDLPEVPAERRADTLSILHKLALLQCDLTLRQAHALWSAWSHRNGTAWMAPGEEVKAPIESVVADLLARSDPPATA